LTNSSQFKKRCQKIRKNVLEIVRYGKRGHIASAFSMVEVLVTLYDFILRVDPENPAWRDRDRFILSKGHGCLALYAILSDKGFFASEAWKGFCAFDGILGGHPTMEKVPGVEASTGSLGHGLPIGVGFALAAKMDKKKYRTFVLLGDGECNEGSVWEAAMGASKNRLDNLVILVDYNKQQAFGSTYEVCDLEPFADKWRSFGFETREVDMVKDPLNLKALLSNLPLAGKKPTAIICHTIKGMGVPFMEGNMDWHYKSKITNEEIDEVLSALED
jgi:transketolase